MLSVLELQCTYLGNSHLFIINLHNLVCYEKCHPYLSIHVWVYFYLLQGQMSRVPHKPTKVNFMIQWILRSHSSSSAKSNWPVCMSRNCAFQKGSGVFMSSLTPQFGGIWAKLTALQFSEVQRVTEPLVTTEQSSFFIEDLQWSILPL